MMEGSEPAPELLDSLGDLGVLVKVREFPVRIKCALLAWSTLEDRYPVVMVGIEPNHPPSRGKGFMQSSPARG